MNDSANITDAMLTNSRKSSKCPRCGYDLRGAIDTWKEQCPLLGICTECGLEVKWAEVLHPEKFEPLWCVEFARSRKLILLSCGKTFLRSFWPFRFWWRMKMSLDIRWRRLAIYLLALLLPMLIGYVSMQSILAIKVRSHMQDIVTDWQNDIQNQIADFNANKHLLTQFYKDNYLQRKSVLEGLLAKDGLNKYTQYLIEEKQKWIDTVDAQGLDLWTEQEVKSQLQILQQSLTPMSINHSYIAAIAEAVFLPLSNKSVGKLSSVWGPQQYPPPKELREYLEIKSIVLSNFYRNDFLTTLTLIILGIWIYLLFPFTFIFLPISRIRAKVRWVHVLRVMCYSSFIPSSVICAALFAVSMSYIFLDSSNLWFDVAHFASRYFMLPMLIIWWALAIKRYMCIAHGWMTAILLAAILAMAYILLFAQILSYLPIDLLT